MNEEQWPLREVVFVEDVKNVPVGKVSTTDSAIHGSEVAPKVTDGLCNISVLRFVQSFALVFPVFSNKSVQTEKSVLFHKKIIQFIWIPVSLIALFAPSYFWGYMRTAPDSELASKPLCCLLLLLLFVCNAF